MPFTATRSVAESARDRRTTGPAVAFIANIRERIDAYVKFGREIRPAWKTRDASTRGTPSSSTSCCRFAGRLDQFYAENRAQIRTPADAQQTADKFRRDLLSLYGRGCLPEMHCPNGHFLRLSGGARAGLSRPAE